MFTKQKKALCDKMVTVSSTSSLVAKFLLDHVNVSERKYIVVYHHEHTVENG